MPDLAKDCVECAYIVADAGYADGRVASTKVQCDRYWKKWRKWCSLVEIDPYLHDISNGRLLRETAVFSGYVRDRAVGRGKQVGVREVGKSISAINMSIEMD